MRERSLGCGDKEKKETRKRKTNRKEGNTENKETRNKNDHAAPLEFAADRTAPMTKLPPAQSVSILNKNLSGDVRRSHKPRGRRESYKRERERERERDGIEELGNGT